MRCPVAVVGVEDVVAPLDLGRGGVRRDSGIARAIVNDPTLLLCDEPTGDLDRQTASEILDLLATLNRRYGKTVIMVTHDPLAAARAGRVLHVDKGVLAEGQAA